MKTLLTFIEQQCAKRDDNMHRLWWLWQHMIHGTTRKTHTHTYAWIYIVRCRYNAINFASNSYDGHPRVLQWMRDIGSICEFNLWFTFVVSQCRVICNVVVQWTALKWHCNLLRLLFGPRGTSKIFSHQLLLNKQYSVCDPKMTITYVYILLYMNNKAILD